MACFDGHKKIFLLGFDGHTDGEILNNVYKNSPGYMTSDDTAIAAFIEHSLYAVMSTYSDVEFVRVMRMPTAYIPPMWASLVNFRQTDYRGFAIEADLG